MTNPIIKIVNLETGEELEREMTAAEIKQIKADNQASLAREEEAQAREVARQSALEKLATLGLTEAEIKALVG